MASSVLLAVCSKVGDRIMLRGDLQQLDENAMSWRFMWNLVFILVIAYSVVRTLRVFYPALPSSVSLAFLVGAFGVSCLRVLSDLVATREKGGLKGGGVLLFVLTLSLLIPSVLQVIFLRESFDFLGRSSVGTTLKIAGFAILWMLIGYEMQRARLKDSNTVSLVLAFAMSLLVFSNLDGGLIINYRLLNAERGDAGEASHLVLGESAVVIIAFAVAAARGVLRYLIGAVGIALLFSMGGRTSLLAFVLSLVAFAIIRSRSVSLSVLVVSGALAIVAIFLPAIADTVVDDQALSRMFLAKGISEEGSLLERGYQFEIGLRGLLEQVYFGDPNFLIERLGGMGTYMHNLLSAWQFFGFFTFFIISFVMLYLLRSIYINAAVFEGVVGHFSKLIFLYSFFCVLIGKYIGFNLIWLGIGLCLGRVLNSGGGGARAR